MSKPLILPNSTSIHGQIKAMFSTQTRGKGRVILVAYVGKEAPQLLIQGLNAAPVTQAALDILQRDHNDTPERQRQISSSSATKTPALLEWFDQPLRRPWKLGWFDGDSVSPSQSALDQSLRDYHVVQPHWWQCCKESDYERSDWALVFELTKGKMPPTQFQRRFIHFVAPTPEKDDAYNENYPFQAVQAVPAHKSTTPPFRLDAPTRAALGAAVERYGATAIRKLAVPRPSAKFLGILREEALSHFAEQNVAQPRRF